MVNIPPAPNPHTALAAMKLSMLSASAHQTVARVKISAETTKGSLRPVTSLMRPKSGWKLVDVRRNDVDNHEASFAAWKWEVMEVCVEAMMVESKAPICGEQRKSAIDGAKK